MKGIPTKNEPIGDIVRIFQRGAKWYANFQLNGKQRRKSLETTSKKLARARAIKLEAELQEGLYRHSINPPSVQAAVTEYKSFLECEDRATTTLVKYAAILKRVVELTDRLKRRDLMGIDISFVDVYRRERVEARKKPKTVYTETVVIRQLVNHALSRGMIVRDPLKGLKNPKPKPTPQPCWTVPQVETILAASSGMQHDAFLVLADTGLRIGELTWLTWADVDLVRNVIYVRPKEGWRPKNRDQRAVPMTPRVRALLQGMDRKGTWVLCAGASSKHPRGDHQISARRLLRSLKRLLKRLELPGKLHTFRHSFISSALIAGIPEAVVRTWVGHVDREVIRQYTHIGDKDSMRAMQRLAEARSVPENEESSNDCGTAETETAQIQRSSESPSSARRAS